jgi:hypothetical protein
MIIVHLAWKLVGGLPRSTTIAQILNAKNEVQVAIQSQKA